MPKYFIESGSESKGGMIRVYVVIKPQTAYDKAVISSILINYGIPKLK